MFRKLIKLKTILVISLFLITNSVYTISSIDNTNRTENLKAFEWEVISGVEKLIPTKEMSKNSIKKLEEANMLYSKGIDLMKSRNYTGAIEQFMLARKSYKRSKISEHDYNYININHVYNRFIVLFRRVVIKLVVKIAKNITPSWKLRVKTLHS